MLADLRAPLGNGFAKAELEENPDVFEEAPLIGQKWKNRNYRDKYDALRDIWQIERCYEHLSDSNGTLRLGRRRFMRF